MRPTPLAALLFAASIVAAVGAALTEPWIWYAVLAVFAALFVVDAAALPRRSGIRARVTAPAELIVGVPGTAVLDVETDARRPLRAWVALETGGVIEPPTAAAGRLARGGLAASFPLDADRRGTARIERAFVRVEGPLRLVRRTVAIAVGVELRVLPRVLATGTGIRAFDAADARVGTKIERYDGDGSEFDTLREFRVGDDPRALDWKATARHRVLLRRKFRAERDHDLVLAIDSGRLMAERVAGVPKIDLAVRAALTLGRIALASGDRVGLFAFDERPRASLRPQGGVRFHEALRRTAATLEAREVETNFTLSLSTLLQTLKRRTLVVVLADFADAISAELLLENLRRLRRRHVVVFVALRDAALDAIEDETPASREGLHRAVVAGTLKRERRVVFERLRRLGISIVTAPADTLTGELIDRYLDLKRREVA